MFRVLLLFGLLLVGFCLEYDSLTMEDRCPIKSMSEMCPAQASNECVIDYDCSATDKCCFDGCSFRCKTPIKTTNKVCYGAIDIGFLIDSSASIGHENFQRIKHMVIELIDKFSVSDEGVHMAAVVYGSKAKVLFNFNTFNGKDLNSVKLRKIIKNMAFEKGKTRLYKALKLTSKEIFQNEQNTRKNVPKILLVFTDGLQTWPPRGDLSLLTRQLKELGVNVFSVGVGKIDIMTLLDIANHQSFVFHEMFFNELKETMTRIIETPCKDTKYKNVRRALLKRKLLKRGQ